MTTRFLSSSLHWCVTIMKWAPNLPGAPSLSLKAHPIQRLAALIPLLVAGVLLLTFIDTACIRSAWKTFLPDQQTAQVTNSTSWISFPTEADYTAAELRRVAENGTKTCHAQQTATISVHSFKPQMSVGELHSFTFTAMDANGTARCTGGDYFETDLSGQKWKSRPPVTDFNNGTYSVTLQVDSSHAGEYTFTVILLFGNHNGLHRGPQKYAIDRVLLTVNLTFVAAPVSEAQLRLCKSEDFAHPAWSGRWTRGRYNETCDIDNAGRFRCLPPTEPCEAPWCEGNAGLLESNGWVYSAHCRFRIFDADSAWRCLDNRWLLFWGDSNHVDSIRNLLNFVLGLWDIPAVPRRFDQNFTRPGTSQTVRITNIFNGHWNSSLNYLGLHSLTNPGFRELTRGYFLGERVPDAVVLNSGLHDAVFYRSLKDYVGDVEFAAAFWDSIMKSLDDRGVRRPDMVYRTTIATGGLARRQWSNPQKIETYNKIIVEKLMQRRLVNRIVDDFDLTFAWHYDNRCSDGVHYGRLPAKARWFGGVGHQYFVDLMLIHTLLSALCGT